MAKIFYIYIVISFKPSFISFLCSTKYICFSFLSTNLAVSGKAPIIPAIVATAPQTTVVRHEDKGSNIVLMKSAYQPISLILKSIPKTSFATVRLSGIAVIVNAVLISQAILFLKTSFL